ncbi:Protein FAR1-RELATED SEQUENCE [Abeliophyllum distichum]|uniref:Protein FAR1-RELATED SEQUENCE n=1 Tax=Abeliophyllum distichum TaxID=126358 RepID=A0ABD1RE50_9LAMI
MPRQAPQIIITDQDAAIAKAIVMVLPFTFHRYCVWHILNKFSEKINVMVYNDEYHMLETEHGKTFDRVRHITYYMESDFISCSCRTFEFNGYPCRHMISYLKKKQVLLLPDKYILRRWTKNAKLGYPDDLTAVISTNDTSGTSLMARHGLLSHKTSLIVDDAVLTDARSTFLMDEFKSLHLRVKEISNGGNIGSTQYKSITRPDSVTIEDPSAVRAKGCGKKIEVRKRKINIQTKQAMSDLWATWANTDVHERDDGTHGDQRDDGTQFGRGDDGTFTSQASSHYDVVNWFL